jgi:peptide/nickel transport system ATP-binding protein
VVGESGAGKSLTGAAIIGLLEPPGRVASARSCWKASASTTWATSRCATSAAADRRHLQDPLTSLNPLYTVGRQLVETILPPARERAEARQRAIQLLRTPAFRRPSSASTTTRTSSRAACASAW